VCLSVVKSFLGLGLGSSMGAEATKSIRAQQREVATRIERLIAKRDRTDAPSPYEKGSRGRVKSAAAAVRRSVRARDAALASAQRTEVMAGLALLRIVEEGLTLAEAFEMVGLTRGVGRRLVAVAQGPTRPPGLGLSTSGRRPRTSRALSDHRDGGTPAAGATSKGTP
jgi:hypothetical protein